VETWNLKPQGVKERHLIAGVMSGRYFKTGGLANKKKGSSTFIDESQS